MDTEHLGRLLGVDDLPTRLDDVERCLVEALDSPTALAAPSRRVTAAGGKRIRPALTIACAAIGDVYDDRVVAAATAAELVQVGSLVHDDLFDGALTRRGTPTISAVEGNDMALVAGNFMLGRAGELAATVGADAAAVLAEAISELCVGQTREMTQLSDPDRTMEDHLESIHGKTASLFRCACQLGAICAHLPERQSEALARFGEQFGMAFQVLDDVLDVVGDARQLGKPVGVDVSTGVYTMPVLVTLAGESGGELRAHLSSGDTTAAMNCVTQSDGIGTALGAVEAYADAAATAAESVDATVNLSEFPRSYLAWALEAFVDRRVWPLG